MFYKKIGNNWYKGKEINLPNGQIINAENKENSEKWEWYDEPPKDFILDTHKDGFSNAIVERQTPAEVKDINSLIISPDVIKNRIDKVFSVAIFLDGNYYFVEKLPYQGLLTENEIEEEVIKFLKSL